MILDLVEWIWEHKMEFTFNAVLLFILRRFILKELTKLFRFNRNDAVLINQKIMMEMLGVGEKWTSSLPMNGLKITLPRLSRKLYLFSFKDTKHPKIRRKKNMKQLLSKKFLLAILGAIIPVINLQFGLNLDINTLIGIWLVLVAGIAAIAHVDSKQIKAEAKTVATVLTADPTKTYKDLVKTVNIVHTTIMSIYEDLKKDDDSAAFHVAADAYTQIKAIVQDIKKPEPLPEVPEKVSA